MQWTQITSVSGYSDIISQFITDNSIRSYSWVQGQEGSANQVIDFLYSLSPSQWDKLADISQFKGFADVLNQAADKLQPMQNFLGLNIADNPWALIQAGMVIPSVSYDRGSCACAGTGMGYTDDQHEVNAYSNFK